jgi:ABC-type phosphate transport system substrate-binding protein
MGIQRGQAMKKRLLGALLVALLSPMAAQADSAAAIAIIVNKDNPVGTLHIGDVARIYRGERGEWPDDQKIVATNHDVESDLRRRFYASVLGAPPTERFRLPGTPIPFHTITFKSSRVILKYVANTPQAIGYVPIEHLDSSVKVLRIDGLLPADASYPVK